MNGYQRALCCVAIACHSLYAMSQPRTSVGQPMILDQQLGFQASVFGALNMLLLRGDPATREDLSNSFRLCENSLQQEYSFDRNLATAARVEGDGENYQRWLYSGDSVYSALTAHHTYCAPRQEPIEQDTEILATNSLQFAMHKRTNLDDFRFSNYPYFAGAQDVIEISSIAVSSTGDQSRKTSATQLFIGQPGWLETGVSNHTYNLTNLTVEQYDSNGNLTATPDNFWLGNNRVHSLVSSDYNGDGIEDIVQIGNVLHSRVLWNMVVTDPVTGNLLRSQNLGTYTTGRWLQNFTTLPDINGNDIDEIAFDYIQNGISRRSILSGSSFYPIRRLNNTRFNYRSWPTTNLKNSEMVTLQDRNRDGAAEVGLFGLSEDRQPQLWVFNGARIGHKMRTYVWPASLNNPQLKQIGDINGDGIAEVAIFGARKDNGHNQLLVKDGYFSDVTYPSYTWPDNWRGAQLFVLRDMNGDGVDEVALFGKRRDDGRSQVVVKDGANPGQILGSYGFPAELAIATRFLAVPDRDADGVDELGVWGRRLDTGKTQLIIKSGKTGQTIERPAWSSSWKNGRVVMLPDLTGDGLEEFALLGNHDSNSYAALVAFDSATGTRMRTFSWRGFDAVEADLHFFSDMNGDGIKELGLYQYDAGVGGKLIIRSGTDPELKLSVRRWGHEWRHSPSCNWCYDAIEDARIAQ
ncbi:MAG: VCBS repeat-containing protein [Gammaproteobacteria bacterium]|nr:VCBS repeat-containing protein [Gammaproteobacteria bacterium]